MTQSYRRLRAIQEDTIKKAYSVELALRDFLSGLESDTVEEGDPCPPEAHRTKS